MTLHCNWPGFLKSWIKKTAYIKENIWDLRPTNLVSDALLNREPGQFTNRWPFSLMELTSRETPWGSPSTVSLGCRWWAPRRRFLLRLRWSWKGSLRSRGTGMRKSIDMFWIFWVQSVACALSSSILGKKQMYIYIHSRRIQEFFQYGIQLWIYSQHTNPYSTNYF